jgi:hypothetical protein
MRIGQRPFPNQPSEYDGGGSAATDHARIAAFERHGIEIRADVLRVSFRSDGSYEGTGSRFQKADRP